VTAKQTLYEKIITYRSGASWKPSHVGGPSKKRGTGMIKEKKKTTGRRGKRRRISLDQKTPADETLTKLGGLR